MTTARPFASAPANATDAPLFATPPHPPSHQRAPLPDRLMHPSGTQKEPLRRMLTGFPGAARPGSGGVTLRLVRVATGAWSAGYDKPRPPPRKENAGRWHPFSGPRHTPRAADTFQSPREVSGASLCFRIDQWCPSNPSPVWTSSPQMRMEAPFCMAKKPSWSTDVTCSTRAARARHQGRPSARASASASTRTG